MDVYYNKVYTMLSKCYVCLSNDCYDNSVDDISCYSLLISS